METTKLVRRSVLTGAALVAAALVGVGRSGAETSALRECEGTQWIPAWTASVQGAGGPLTSTMTGHSLTPPNDTFEDETLRQVAHLHFSGEKVRITLSNLFGIKPVTFNETHVGLRGEGASLQRASDRPVTFAGASSVAIPAGGEVVSDPVPLAVEPFSNLVVSTYTAQPTGPATLHANAVQNYYTAAGNHTGDAGGGAFAAGGDVSRRDTATFTTQVYFLRVVEVLAPAAARTVVAFGESTTDGFYSSGDANHRYPDVLARRFLANPATSHLAVVGQAISGNRILHDGIGPSALHRLEREVLSLDDVAAVIFMEGLNDIGQPMGVRPPDTLQERVSAEEIIAGYKEIARRVHEKGVSIIIGTLTPAGDTTRPVLYGLYSTPDGVAKRHAVNDWLRTKGHEVFDGVVDADTLLRSATNPNHIDPKYDGGDNLHPNDAGYKVMADAIPLDFFEGLPHC